MLRIISLNLNGIRAAFRKGLADWLKIQKPDFVCLQELKAQEDKLTEEMLNPENLQGYFSFAERPGYSGVGIYTRHKPKTVNTVFENDQVDTEGRFIRLDYQDHSVVSFYLPSGSSGTERQTIKYQIMDLLYERLASYQKEYEKTGRDFIVCGDFNIAHTKQDICNWRGNQKNSGFLPEEREWFGQVLNELKWVDVFRNLNTNDGEYTWWSNRGQAWQNNVGWRIDYQLVTKSMAERAKQTTIYKDSRFSDHAPLTIDYAK